MTLSAENSPNVSRIAPIVLRPRVANGWNAGSCASLLDHQRRVHAAEVVAGHVAEQDVAARGQAKMQLADRGTAEGLERAGLPGLQSILVDREPIGPEGKPGSVLPHDDQFVVVRSAISREHLDGAGTYPLRRNDLEVRLLDPKNRDARTAGLLRPRRSRSSHRRRRESP